MLKVIFNRKALKSLMLASIILFAAIMIGYLFHHVNRNEKSIHRVENIISEKIGIIEQKLEGFHDKTVPEKLSQTQFKNNEAQGLIFLSFYKNKLRFWSSNTVSVDHYYSTFFDDNDIVRLGNGYYIPRTLHYEEITYVGLLLVTVSYDYENQYIKDKFNPIFRISDKAGFSIHPSSNNIYGPNGAFLFSIDFPEKLDYSESLIFLLLFLYLAALLFVINGLYYMSEGFKLNYKDRKWLFMLFVADVIIIRAALFYFKVPTILYETKLFGPSYLAISELLPSLGDLFVNAVVLLTIAWYFFKSFNFNFDSELSKKYKTFTAFSLLFHVYIFFYLYQLLFIRIVFDSIVSFNLSNIFSLNAYSLIGFLSIACILLALFLISTRLVKAAKELFPRPKNFILLLGFATILTIVVSSIRGHFQPFSVIFVFLLILTLFYNRKLKLNSISFAWIIFYLVVFALITTYSLQTLNSLKEKQERKLLAIELAADRDRIAEYRFARIESDIYENEQLLSLLIDAYFGPVIENEVIDYIKTEYFDSYWDRFDVLITFCFPGKELHIRPGDYIIDCHTYFEGYIGSLGEKTENEGLYYIFPGVNYLARFNFQEVISEFGYPVTVYVEISSKAVSKGLGYPELLIAETSASQRELYNYSYATFKYGELVRSVGRYPYSILDTELPNIKGYFIYFDRNNYNHLLYNASSNIQLVVSLPKPVFLDILAPFSYLFIFFGFFVFFFSLITGFSQRRSFSEISFRNRIQYSMFGIVFVSFLVIGTSTLFYISRLNQNKNINHLSEKNHSILIELEHHVGDLESLDIELTEYLNDLLTRLSLVYFTDINLYDPQGWLLASSRPQIFEQGLISERMHPEAFLQLAHHYKSSFIHNERIGTYNYLSSYLPFRNDQNKLIGFVNLPYFARQSELRQEISNFLVAFTNIYVVLMAIGLFLALVLSDYLLRPLMMLKANLRKIKLSESTEKIHWKGNDEISELINDYNRMTDELLKSAEMLAKSERESAWREMARQVAHEIKNPLTPMKLSVQYLHKAWSDQAPDWDERLKRFTETLTHQIDTLSEIASAFSDFATMPAANNEKVNLPEAIRSAAALYSNIENISIEVKTPEDESQCLVLADKRQMLRVFNNLIKNSIQAIREAPGGRIEIDISRSGNHLLIKVYDNGAGISSEQQAKIFSPYFTTKSSGMGLGLAIVNNIISGIGGTISFQSEENNGTTFRILLPVYAENE